MTFVLKPLPYDVSALEPVISARTLELHHGKHHAGYVAKLNQLVAGSTLENADLESIIRAGGKRAKQVAIYNNAAQAWNHDFFWMSIAPNGGGAPPEPLAGRIATTFGSVDNFVQHFVDVAAGHFGSGWVWLTARAGELDVVATHDAGSPLTTDFYPLMVCDVWEHAYYLDYQNRRAEYVKALLEKLINWRHVASQLEAANHWSGAQKRAHA